MDRSGIQARSYFSPQHLWAARHFARVAADVEREHAGELGLFIRQRAHVIAAIGEVAAFVEAFINEVLRDAAQDAGEAVGGLSADQRSRLGEYGRGHERDEILTKYQMARLLCDVPRSDAGRRPQQDLKYVIRMRNWLAHYKPTTVSEWSPIKDFDHVRGRFFENPHLEPAGANWFPEHALSASCAEWATSSAIAFVREFIEALGLTTSFLDFKHDEDP